MSIASPLSSLACWQRYRTRRNARRHIVLAGCNSIVSAARQEHFYTDWQVPDSFEGRFEMTIIHATLVLRRLNRCGQVGQDLAQDICDALFRSFDDSLRASGVGDLSVGKKIKRMAQSFYGRATAYDQAVPDSGVEPSPALLASIERNLELSSSSTHALACYICRASQSLNRTSNRDMLSARFDWPTK